MSKKVSNTLKEGESKEVLIGRRFAVQFDLNYHGLNGPAQTGKSMTHPDMNLTVRQLLENHTRGRDGKVNVNQPLYFDVEIPNIRDITDVQAYKDYLQDRLKSTEEFIKAEKDAKAKAEADAKAKAEELSPSNGNETEAKKAKE